MSLCNNNVTLLGKNGSCVGKINSQSTRPHTNTNNIDTFILANHQLSLVAGEGERKRTTCNTKWKHACLFLMPFLSTKWNEMRRGMERGEIWPVSLTEVNIRLDYNCFLHVTEEFKNGRMGKGMKGFKKDECCSQSHDTAFYKERKEETVGRIVQANCHDLYNDSFRNVEYFTIQVSNANEFLDILREFLGRFVT